MTKQEYTEQVKKIVSDRLCVDIADIKPEADLVDDLHADELDVIDIELDVEELLEVVIPEDVCEKIHTVNDLVEFTWGYKESLLS